MCLPRHQPEARIRRRLESQSRKGQQLAVRGTRIARDTASTHMGLGANRRLREDQHFGESHKPEAIQTHYDSVDQQVLAHQRI